MTSTLSQPEIARNVAILGAGAAGLAAYVLLEQAGHRPVLFSPSGASTEVFARGQMLEATGAIEATVTPRFVTQIADAVTQADAILIAMPANGHRAMFDLIAPLLTPAQMVIISAHASFGALYLDQLLAARGIEVPIAVWSRTISRTRRTEPGRVRFSNLRGADLACLPASRLDDALALCTALFGARFKPRGSLLETSLANMNPHSHLGLALGNITRMERGEDWAQHDLQTPAVCNLFERLDLERAAIAAAFGLKVPSSRENYAANLGEDAPLPELAARLYAREQEKGVVTMGPKTLNSRYVLEDMPFGVATTLTVAQIAAVPATLHQAGLAIMSAFYDRDFAAENDILPQLGLAQMSAADFSALCQTGFSRKAPL